MYPGIQDHRDKEKTPRSAENLNIVCNLKTFLYPLKASLINVYTHSFPELPP